MFPVPTKTASPPASARTIKATVADQTARFALAVDDVQQGDLVYQTDTSATYIVVDETALGSGAGYYLLLPSPVPVANGGTGASTAAGARANLGVPEGGGNSGLVSAWFGPGAAASIAGTAVGALANSGISGVALGAAAFAASGAVAIGSDAVSSVPGEIVFGSGGSPLSALYCGKGRSHAAPTAWGIFGTRGGGTNVAGGACILAGGASTGNAAGGPAKLMTSPPGSSGASVNTLVDRFEADANGVCWIHPVTTAPTVGRSNQIGLFSDAGVLKAILPDNSVVTLDYT